jgi:hypothetical protein
MTNLSLSKSTQTTPLITNLFKTESSKDLPHRVCSVQSGDCDLFSIGHEKRTYCDWRCETMGVRDRCEDCINGSGPGNAFEVSVLPWEFTGCHCVVSFVFELPIMDSDAAQSDIKDGSAKAEPPKAPPIAEIPNGGFKAWTQVVGSFFLYFNGW